MPKKGNSLTELRNKLGLNQAQIGSLLNISRSRVSMSEGGRRDLPFSALLTLSKVALDFQGLETGDLSNYRTPETNLFMNRAFENILPLMLIQESWCRGRAKILLAKLDLMKKKAFDLENWIMIITRVIEQIAEQPGSGGEVERLTALQANAYQEILSCWQPEQAKLHARIEALRAEARALRSYRTKMQKRADEAIRPNYPLWSNIC